MNNFYYYTAGVIQRMQYYPSGLPWYESTNPQAQQKKYNGKEWIEAHGYDSYDYHARTYYPALMRFTTPDPLAEKYYSVSPYAYCNNNPVRFIDPDGRMALQSTDVTKNEDGSYTVVEAKNDKDNNIYVVNNAEDKERTGEIIGQTENPWDFMSTSEDGTFSGHKKVTFDLNNLPDGNSMIENYSKEWKIISALINDSKKSLIALAVLSKNYGRYDIKTDFSKSTGGAYTVVSYNGKITTIRTAGNILFGKNLRAINKISTDQIFIPAKTFYKLTMPVVGLYNQIKNKGNGYNSGFPFYGEHTYSGTGIYKGYFNKKP